MTGRIVKLAQSDRPAADERTPSHAERLRLEESLRRSEARFTNVLQASPLGVHMYSLDAEDRLVFDGYNPAADRILGIDHAQFLGRTIEEAFPPLRDTEVPTRYREAARDGSSWEHEQIDYDDQVIRGAFEIKAFQTAPRAMAVMFRDITEQQRMAKQLRDAHDQLGQRVAERTADLVQANRELETLTVHLVQSAKLAALGELTAGIAHELNQPLNAIKITCQGVLLDLRKGRLEEGALGEKLTSVVQMVNKMAELIRHMRIFTRPPSDAPTESVDLNEVVRSAFAFLGQQLVDHGIEVHNELSAGPLPIDGDPVGLEQVVVSLLSNARQAVDRSRRPDKQIAVSTQSRAERALLTVRDNGVGIPEADRHRVFQPFFTTGAPGEGTGLGLAVAKKIIEEHRGQIVFESEPGLMTRFELTLPLAESRTDGEGNRDPAIAPR